MNLIAQYVYKVHKPLFDPLVHDPVSKIIIITISLAITILALVVIWKKFNEF